MYDFSNFKFFCQSNYLIFSPSFTWYHIKSGNAFSTSPHRSNQTGSIQLWKIGCLFNKYVKVHFHWPIISTFQNYYMMSKSNIILWWYVAIVCHVIIISSSCYSSWKSYFPLSVSSSRSHHVTGWGECVHVQFLSTTSCCSFLPLYKKNLTFFFSCLFFFFDCSRPKQWRLPGSGAVRGLTLAWRSAEVRLSPEPIGGRKNQDY